MNIYGFFFNCILLDVLNDETQRKYIQVNCRVSKGKEELSSLLLLTGVEETDDFLSTSLSK